MLCGTTAASANEKETPSVDPAKIRTWNPLIRSQMPYPLGHGASNCRCKLPTDFFEQQDPTLNLWRKISIVIDVRTLCLPSVTFFNAKRARKQVYPANINWGKHNYHSTFRPGSSALNRISPHRKV